MKYLEIKEISLPSTFNDGVYKLPTNDLYKIIYTDIQSFQYAINGNNNFMWFIVGQKEELLGAKETEEIKEIKGVKSSNNINENTLLKTIAMLANKEPYKEISK